MANIIHLKVLLQKDLLTLRRNVGFIIAFVFLPIALMAAFIAIQGLVDNGEKEGSLLQENFRYSTTKYLNKTIWDDVSQFIPLDDSTKELIEKQLPFPWPFDAPTLAQFSQGVFPINATGGYT